METINEKYKRLAEETQSAAYDIEDCLDHNDKMRGREIINGQQYVTFAGDGDLVLVIRIQEILDLAELLLAEPLIE